MLAATQTSRVTSPDCHSDSAAYTASWVLPQAPSQSRTPAVAARAGTSATVAPGARTALRLGDVSGRELNPSASGGTTPDRTGWAGCPSGHSAGPRPASG